MSDLFAAFTLVFVAELGDKTQLVALGFGARHRLAHVVVGLAIAYVAAGLVSVGVGALIGTALPSRAVSVLGGVLFLGFAIWTLREADDVDHTVEGVVKAGGRQDPAATETASTHSAGAVIGSVVVAMFVAEFGDKTMLATATLASRGNVVAVFAGATVGIFLAGVLGAAIGRAVGERLPDRVIRLGAAMMFAVFGVVLLVSAI